MAGSLSCWYQELERVDNVNSVFYMAVILVECQCTTDNQGSIQGMSDKDLY